jgi:cytochrome b561
VPRKNDKNNKNKQTQTRKTSPVLAYSPMARAFHWVTVAFVATLMILGEAMTYRSKKDIWDGLTNGLYSAHKLLGFTLLGIVIARLIYRFTKGAPVDEPTLEPWQKLASHVTHWSLYGLLLLVPILGWRGVSQYPALEIFGLFKLPAIAAADQAASATTFFWHETLGKVMALLIVTHVGAALFHHIVRKDGVLRRMLPKLPQKLK